MKFHQWTLSKPVLVIVLGLLCCFAAKRLAAQSVKPNLSGTWELNVSKSKLSRLHRAGTDRYKIRHSDPRLMMEHTYPSGNTDTSYYTTDGKQGLPNPQYWQELAKAYWDGDTLVIEKHQETSQVSITWMYRYTLSRDGHSLAVTRHVTKNSFSADLDESLIYEKRK
jgi:hypothetical protein